jgi:transcriptional regulator with XRE-family HTH domain
VRRPPRLPRPRKPAREHAAHAPGEGERPSPAPPRPFVFPTTPEEWRRHLEALGEFIRSQRHLANLSLRDLADRTHVSNPYLSQIERGLHQPSVRVLKAIADALNLSAETLLARAGLLGDEDETRAETPPSTEDAIRADPALSEEQKTALLAVYRSYAAANA